MNRHYLCVEGESLLTKNLHPFRLLRLLLFSIAKGTPPTNLNNKGAKQVSHLHG